MVTELVVLWIEKLFYLLFISTPQLQLQKLFVLFFCFNAIIIVIVLQLQNNNNNNNNNKNSSFQKNLWSEFLPNI